MEVKSMVTNPCIRCKPEQAKVWVILDMLSRIVLAKEPFVIENNLQTILRSPDCSKEYILNWNSIIISLMENKLSSKHYILFQRNQNKDLAIPKCLQLPKKKAWSNVFATQKWLIIGAVMNGPS